VQEVDGLLVPFPAEAEVESEVALHAEVVLAVKSQIVFLEIEIERTLGEGELAAGCASRAA